MSRTPYAYRFVLSESTAPAAMQRWARTIAMSLGQESDPLLLLSMRASDASLGSQIAVQLGSKSCVENALAVTGDADGDRAGRILRESLRQANTDVFNYAQSLGAAGKLAAECITVVADGHRIVIARNGLGSAFVRRNQELLPLFDESAAFGLLGAEAQLLTELVSTTVADFDELFVSSLSERELYQLLLGAPRATDAEFTQICSDSLQAQALDSDDNPAHEFVCAYSVHSDIVVLTEVLT